MTQSVREWVSDKGKQWSDSGPIKIVLKSVSKIHKLGCRHDLKLQTFLNKNPPSSIVSDDIDHFLDLGQIKLCWLYVALHDIRSLMEFGNRNLKTLVATLRIPNWFPIQYYDVTWIMRFKPFTVYQPGLQLAWPRRRSWDKEQNMTSQPVVCHALLSFIKQ